MFVLCTKDLKCETAEQIFATREALNLTYLIGSVLARCWLRRAEFWFQKLVKQVLLFCEPIGYLGHIFFILESKICIKSKKVYSRPVSTAGHSL